jgi:hypothetical protein
MGGNAAEFYPNDHIKLTTGSLGVDRLLILDGALSSDYAPLPGE